MLYEACIKYAIWIKEKNKIQLAAHTRLGDLQLIPIPREMMQPRSSVPSWQLSSKSHLSVFGTQCSLLSHKNMESLKQLLMSKSVGISKEQK